MPTLRRRVARNRPRRWAILLGGEAHNLTTVVGARTKWVNVPFMVEDEIGKPIRFGTIVYERLPRIFDEGRVEKFIPKEPQ